MKRWLAAVATLLIGTLTVPSALAAAPLAGPAQTEAVQANTTKTADLAVQGVAAGPAATYVFLDGGFVLVFGGGGLNQPSLLPLTGVRQIAEGGAGRFALLDTGAVWWEDTSGERPEWRLLLDTDDVRRIAVTDNGVVLVRTTGTLWFYDMASGTLAPMGLDFVYQVAVGDGWILALVNGGRVYGLGDNRFGVLGAETGPDGAAEWTALPVSGVQALAGGGHSAFFLCEDGTVLGLGLNAWGVLGTKAASWTGVPVRIPFSAKIAAIAASPDGRNLFAVTTTGEVYGLGANDSGQLGLGSGYHVVKGTPTKLDLKHVAEIAVGNAFIVARDTSGTIRGLGRTNAGQLGTASRDPYFGYEMPHTLRATSPETLFEQAVARAKARPDYLPVARQLYYLLPADKRAKEYENNLTEAESAVASAAEAAVARAEKECTLDALLAARELVAALRSEQARPLVERLAPVEQEVAKAGDVVPPTIVSVMLTETGLTVTASDSAQYPYAASGVVEIRMRFDNGNWFTYNGPVLWPATAATVYVQAVDAHGNASAETAWSLDVAAAEQAVTALEGLQLNGTTADVATVREAVARTHQAVAALVDGEQKTALLVRYAEAARRAQSLLAARAAGASVQAADQALKAFLNDTAADGDAVAAQIAQARELLDRRGWTDASLEQRLSVVATQFATTRARRLVSDVAATTVTTRSDPDDVFAYKWAVERAGLAVAQVPNPVVAASLTAKLANVQAKLADVWADLMLDRAEAVLKAVADNAALDEIELLLGQARTAIAHVVNDTQRNSYERRLERAQSSAQSARVTLAIRAAQAAAENVTLDTRSEVEALFETANKLVQRLGNSTLKLKLKDAQGTLYQRLAVLYLDQAEQTLNPDTIREAEAVIGQLSYSVRKPYAERLAPLTNLVAAEEAVKAVDANYAEWEKTLLKANLAKNLQSVTRAYSNYTSQLSRAEKLVKDLPENSDNARYTEKVAQLRERLQEQQAMGAVAERVMTLVRGRVPDDQKEVKLRFGVHWAVNLNSVYADELRRTLGSVQPNWVNLTPNILTLYDNGQIITDAQGTGVVIGWTRKGVIRVVVTVSE